SGHSRGHARDGKGSESRRVSPGFDGCRFQRQPSSKPCRGFRSHRLIRALNDSSGAVRSPSRRRPRESPPTSPQPNLVTVYTPYFSAYSALNSASTPPRTRLPIDTSTPSEQLLSSTGVNLGVSGESLSASQHDKWPRA